METQEIWKDIIGYEWIYQVNNNGIVKSIDYYVKHGNSVRMQKGRFLKSHICHKGYYRYSLSLNGKRTNCSSHRLVAQTFIPNPLNKSQVNHINGIKTDNRIENLEWVCNQENILHAYKMGLVKLNYGEKHHMSKVSNSQSIEIRSKRKEGVTLNKLSVEYGVSKTAIHNIAINKTYKSVTI